MLRRGDLHPDDDALLDAIADWLVAMRGRRLWDAKRALERVNGFGLLLGWRSRLFDPKGGAA